MKHGLLFFCLLLSSGCISNRMLLDPQFKQNRAADYEDYMDHWWWGFQGHPKFDLAKICLDQKPLAFDESKRFTDVLFTVVTLGVYTPTTLRVWCGDRHE